MIFFRALRVLLFLINESDRSGKNIMDKFLDNIQDRIGLAVEFLILCRSKASCRGSHVTGDPC